MGSATPGVEPASTHDETSSSDRTKDDDDAGASDDDSDDRVDPQHHDPERLKAFNVSSLYSKYSYSIQQRKTKARK